MAGAEHDDRSQRRLPRLPLWHEKPAGAKLHLAAATAGRGRALERRTGAGDCSLGCARSESGQVNPIREMTPADTQLAGQIAVVTGGSGGIGTAIVHALREAGAIAISLDVSPPPSKDTPWIRCDVRDDASVAAAMAQVASEHRRLDLAIHGAGVSREAVIWKLALDDWDFIQSVNLRGAFLLLRHAIPQMRRGSGGRVVLIGSINGSRGKFGT